MRIFLLFVLTAMISPLLLTGCKPAAEAPDVTLERARILSERRQFEDAVGLFSKVLQSMPDRADVYFLRGVAYENAGLPEKALPDYTRCLELDPTRTDALNNKGVVLARLERYEEAVDEFTRLVELQPDDALALRNRGLSRHDLGRYEAAIEDYTKALQLAPNDAMIWFQRGNVYLDQKTPDLADRDFSSAIERDPTLAKAWMNRGVARFQLGQKQLAGTDLTRAQELDDNIILPGIDFFTDDAPLDAATTAAKTSGDPAQNPAKTLESELWKSVLLTARTELEGRGFDQIEVLREWPSHFCAVIRAEMMGVERTIFVGCRRPGTTAEPEAKVVISGEIHRFRTPDASAPGDIAAFPVLVIVALPKIPGELPTIELYDEEWQADAVEINPLLSEIAI